MLCHYAERHYSECYGTIMVEYLTDGIVWVEVRSFTLLTLGYEQLTLQMTIQKSERKKEFWKRNYFDLFSYCSLKRNT
jgi:hypothetical protein